MDFSLVLSMHHYLTYMVGFLVYENLGLDTKFILLSPLEPEIYEKIEIGGVGGGHLGFLPYLGAADDPPKFFVTPRGPTFTI